MSRAWGDFVVVSQYVLYTKNTSKVQKDAVLTAVSDSDMDDVFKE
jgi:hypothetical protein